MAVMLGNKWGKEIADLLGLKDTRKITITIPYDDFVLVEVEALLRAEDSQHITGWIQTKRYELREIEADEPVNLFDDGIAETTAHGDVFRTREASITVTLADFEPVKEWITSVRDAAAMVMVSEPRSIEREIAVSALIHAALSEFKVAE